MYTIRATAHDKKNLPVMMGHLIRYHQSLGRLEGLSHLLDDKIEKLPWGWEMTSCWGTPEEAREANYQSDLQSDVEEIIYGTDILREAVGALWDLLEENALTIDQFRQEILDALQTDKAYENVVNALVDWSDRLEY